MGQRGSESTLGVVRSTEHTQTHTHIEGVIRHSWRYRPCLSVNTYREVLNCITPIENPRINSVFRNGEPCRGVSTVNVPRQWTPVVPLQMGHG